MYLYMKGKPFQKVALPEADEGATASEARTPVREPGPAQIRHSIRQSRRVSHLVSCHRPITLSLGVQLFLTFLKV